MDTKCTKTNRKGTFSCTSQPTLEIWVPSVFKGV
jgi:hypothetical protein